MDSCGTSGLLMPDGSYLCMGDKVNPNYQNGYTVGNGDTTNNIWFQPKAPGFRGRCILDQMTFDQVLRVLSTIPGAKADLIRITDDDCLLWLAHHVSIVVPEKEDNKRVMDRINKNTLPFYTVLRGNMDGSVR